VIAKLHGEMVKALQLTEVRERIAGLGFESVGNSPRNSASSSKTTSRAGRRS